MTEDYFEARKTGGSKNSIEITLDIKKDKVMDFAYEIKQAVLDEVLEVIDKVSHKASARGQFWTAEKTIKVLRRDVEALKGGEQE